jgi:uncharacterized membrane protein
MQLVNFWLVSIAFLGAAFVQARSGSLRPVAIGICVTGAVASLAFAILDDRTRRLVQVAEVALLKLEGERVAAGADSCMQLASAAHMARSSRVSSYRLVIESLQAIVAMLFVAAAIYTAVGG